MTKAWEWAQRVEAWRASGKSAAAFCEKREYSAKSLQWWSSQLRRRERDAKPPHKPFALARVVRAAEPLRMSRSANIVITLGDALVEVPAGTERTALGVVLQALRDTQTAGRR